MQRQMKVACVILLAAALAWAGHGALQAARPAVPAAPTDLQKEAARLSEATGMNWRASPRERAPGIGPELSAATTAWHGVAVPYIVLPYGLDDEGKAKLALYRQSNNMALDLVAADAKRTVLAGPSRESVITAKVLAALQMQELPESAQTRIGHIRAEWLDFRLCVTKAVEADANAAALLENGPSAEQIADYAQLLVEKGPNGGRHRGDPFLWYWTLPFCEMPPSLVTAPDRQKIQYTLLSDRPEQVVLSGSARPRPWHLKRAVAAKDPAGQPAVLMEFDETAAKRLETLTAANTGRLLAVLFHSNVMAVVKIEARISDKLVISGGKLDQALVERIVTSLNECMLAENETRLPPRLPAGSI